MFSKCRKVVRDKSLIIAKVSSELFAIPEDSYIKRLDEMKKMLMACLMAAMGALSSVAQGIYDFKVINDEGKEVCLSDYKGKTGCCAKTEKSCCKQDETACCK